MRKWLTIGVALGILFWLLFSFKNLMRFPLIISRWDAKEYCSCRFVMGREAEFCEEQVRQWVPIQSREVNEQEAMVASKGFWIIAYAKYFGPEEGCRLINTPISRF